MASMLCSQIVVARWTVTYALLLTLLMVLTPAQCREVVFRYAAPYSAVPAAPQGEHRGLIQRSWEWDGHQESLKRPKWLLAITVLTNTLWEQNGVDHPADPSSSSSNHVGWCPQCESLRNATRQVVESFVEKGLLSKAAPTQTLDDAGSTVSSATETPFTVVYAALDCGFVDATMLNHTESSVAPWCALGTQSVPAVRLVLREGPTTVRDVWFKGADDALAIATWMQAQLPASYALSKASISEIASATPGRALMRPTSWMLRPSPPKNLVAFVKEHPSTLTVILSVAPGCRRSLRYAQVLDAVYRVLNSSGVSNESVAIFLSNTEDTVWKGRWLPVNTENPAILFFLPTQLTDGRTQAIPLPYVGPVAVDPLLRSIRYWGASSLALTADWRMSPTDSLRVATLERRLARSPSGEEGGAAHGNRAISSWTRQFVGIRASNLSEFVHVVVNDDHAALKHSTTIPPHLDYTQAVELGQQEEEPRLRHMFVTFFAGGSGTLSSSNMQPELNHFLSMARRYDNLNNAVTATFSIVDLDSTEFTVGSELHRIYLGADPSIALADVCLQPPCVVTCVQLRARKNALRCGGESGLAFNRMTAVNTMDELERMLNLASDPTSDEEVNIKPRDALSAALESSPAVYHADSLRPWFAAESDVADPSQLGKAHSEGRKTAMSGVLLHRKSLLVLLYGGQDTSSSGLDYSRRILRNFRTLCKELNSTVGQLQNAVAQWTLGEHHGSSHVLCVAVHAAHRPRIAAAVRKTFPRVSNEALKQSALAADPQSPFLAVLQRFADNSVDDGVMVSAEPPAAHLQRRTVLDVTPEMLMNRLSQVRDAVNVALGRGRESSLAASDSALVVRATAPRLPALIRDPEKATLLLFSGGLGCSHSATLTSILGEVAEAMRKERRELTVAVVDAHSEFEWDELQHVYRVPRLPAIVFYPKGHVKTLDSGELYLGVPQKLQILEYVHDEMNYAFYEMDWVKDSTVPAVTRRDFEDRIGSPRARNQSHTLLFLYRTLNRDYQAVKTLRELQERFEALPELERRQQPGLRNHADDHLDPIASVDNASVPEIAQSLHTEGGVNMYKMDARRFATFLVTKGLLQRWELESPHGLPKVLFFPRGEPNLLNFRAAALTASEAQRSRLADPDGKKNTRGAKPAVTTTSDAALTYVNAFDAVTLSQFILSSALHVTMRDASERIRFTPDELADHERYEAQAKAPLTIVKELDIHSFRAFVDDLPDVVVLFYATWCKHSSAFMPRFEEIAAHFDGDPSIKFGKINIPENDEIGHGQGILAFPTVRLYFTGSRDKSSLVGYDYPMKDFLDEPVDANATQRFIDFVTATRRTSRVEEMDHERALRERSLLELNDTSFDTVVTQGKDQVLVEFYAPWCGHCRTVIPELQAVGDHFRRQRRSNPIRPRVVIAKIDATRYRNVSARYNATTYYPSILLFTNERNAKGDLVRKVHKYNDHRLADRMVAFVEEALPRVASDYDDKSRGTTPSRPGGGKRPSATGVDDPTVGDRTGGELPQDSRQAKETDQQAEQRKRRKSSEEKLEEMYESDDDLKEVVRKRNALRSARAPKVKVIERRRTLSREIRSLVEDELQKLLTTTTIVAVLHCEARVDEEHLDAWNIVGETLAPLIEKKLVVIGVVEASESSSTLKGLLGEAPSITIFRGLATPQIVRYKMLDPYEDKEAFAKTKAGEGGSGTNATEIVEFVRRTVFSTLMTSAELKTARDYELVTQNTTARVLVFFYAPWSREAQLVAPVYDALAQQFMHVKNYFVTRVDASKLTKVYDKMHRPKLPLILCYDNVTLLSQGTESRKLPRRLLVDRPTREQLAVFFAHEEDSADGSSVAQDVLVPYGDEDVAHGAQDASATKAGGDHRHGSRAPAEKRVSHRLAPIYPWKLLTVSALETFLGQYARTGGALVFFSTWWCRGCINQLPMMISASNKICDDVAVAVLNVSTTEDATSLKSRFGISHFPTISLFVGDAANESAIARHDFLERRRSALEGASLLVKFVVNLTGAQRRASDSPPMPEYPLLASERAAAAERDGVPSSSPATLEAESASGILPDGTTRVATLEALRRLLQVSPDGAPSTGGGSASADSASTPTGSDAIESDGSAAALSSDADTDNDDKTPASSVVILFVNASWCSPSKCGSSMIQLLRTLQRSMHAASAITASTTTASTAPQVAVVDISDKAVKQELQTRLHAMPSAPSVLVACGRRLHRFTTATLESRDTARRAAVVASILEFVDDVCFNLVSVEVVRRRLEEQQLLAEEGPVVAKLYDDILSSTEPASHFVLFFNASTCSRSAQCRDAERMMRRLSGTHKNRQLIFCTVDVNRRENAKRLSEAVDMLDLTSYPGAIQFAYFPLEGPPTVYQGEVQREDIAAFLVDQDRRARESHRPM